MESFQLDLSLWHQVTYDKLLSPNTITISVSFESSATSLIMYAISCLVSKYLGTATSKSDIKINYLLL